ncbi:TonB-dependent receptor [Caulobacter vibrioides]|uniref:TonB-dependent receptor n=2 Tax=Caulobacter vibrioides TaxID=155892 RepID=Q9A608_CAUVC|nr:TonB-dependent receptor [Caulobacter vibrioides]YP_002517743.1 TonB-dependent maltose outer membrane transporter malA [Caulobacter vibrioides NA1000]AAK24258.1 TonB-dependent receptor [Caulobacter vibrioides CB15]ACL95835.1 TonB-dependent maltose outer membrane transporter malA [Caulobacter vibrioides NA1000]ATC29150.1 TonB-dependent receptor [Caulobacter vibrioides]QXZ50661.1 TonB-dependent receptor [Caulobacter vibrioides]
MNTQFSRRRAWLMAGGATGLALAFAVAGSAQAQTTTTAADDTKVEEVVITGIRAGLENSIALKKQSTSIVEAISAEDIGKLPDTSIAESLARLPGLTAQRLDGRAQVISIRGLGPDFTSTLLNGREQVSTGDNRGVEFDQYPSEILSGVVVYKTPDAGLIGQGLSGTADLRTIRPLTYGKRILSANARYEMNSEKKLNPDAKDTGHRFSATYVNQFANDTVGLALAISDISTPTQSKRFNAWGYPTINAANDRVIGGAKPYIQSNNLERFGAIGVLEYKPNDKVTTSLDVYYSEFQEEQILRGIELPLQWSSATLQPTRTTTAGLITNGTFSGVKGVMRNDLNTRDTTLKSAGWNLNYLTDNGWSLTTDLSYSSADRTDVIFESYSGTGPNGVGATDTLGFTTTPGAGTMFASTLDYTDRNQFKLTDPQGWGGGASGGALTQAGFYNTPSITDELTAARFTAKRDLEWGPVKSVEFGLNASRREKDKEVHESFLTFGGRIAAGAPTSRAIPQEAIIGVAKLDLIGIKAMLAYDPTYLLKNGFYTLIADANPAVQTRNWSVREDVQVAYAKFGVDSQVGSIPVTGNFGLQVVRTDQFSKGVAVNPSAPASPTVTDDGAKYTYALPSLNLTFDAGNELYIRVGAARTLARARMDELRASQSFNQNTSRLTSTDPNNSYFSANGGNPNLRPYIADGVDVAVEKYFGRSAYLSAAVYHKELSNFVNSNSSSYKDFSDYLFLLSTAQQAQLGTKIGLVSGPDNGDGGYIRGLELSASLQGELLWEPLKSFGLIISGSFTDSKVTLEKGTNPITIPGLSKTVVNTTFYYEKNGFNARISNRYRGKFLGEVAGLSAARVFRTVDKESVVDAQIGYEFRDGPMNGLSLLLQANNITNEPFKTYDNNDQRQTIDYQKYGATYMVGVSYRF